MALKGLNLSTLPERLQWSGVYARNIDRDIPDKVNRSAALFRPACRFSILIILAQCRKIRQPSLTSDRPKLVGRFELIW